MPKRILSRRKSTEDGVGGTRQGITVSYCALLLDFLFVHYLIEEKLSLKKERERLVAQNTTGCVVRV